MPTELSRGIVLGAHCYPTATAVEHFRAVARPEAKTRSANHSATHEPERSTMFTTLSLAPPFNHESALAKVCAAEDAWNSQDPDACCASLLDRLRMAQSRSIRPRTRSNRTSSSRRNGNANSTIGSPNRCGLLPRIESPFVSSTSIDRPTANGFALMETRTGNSMPMA